MRLTSWALRIESTLTITRSTAAPWAACEVGLDLHSSFSILKRRILEEVGKPSDLVLSHPPYHNIVVYSGNEQGRGVAF